MIGRKAEAVLNRAVRNAIEHEHEYFTLEHVLWSLLDEADVAEVIRACSGDPVELRRELDTYLRKEVPKAPRGMESASPEPEPSPFGDSPVDRRRTPRNAARISGQVNEPPPLLLPESSGYQRGGFIRRMRWAALVLVTVGAGYVASHMRGSSNYAFEGELNPLRLGDSTPVVSEEERSPAAANAGGESLQTAAKAAPPAESKAPAAKALPRS